MRLLSIELKNFQGHGQTLIEFAPITTIKGPTDAGKSAVIRAIRWICLNDLVGDEFIKEGERKAQIILRFRHDKKEFEAVRTRATAGANTYHLNGTEYKSFSTSVPADLATLFRVSEINFQSQHDSPFWFAETAGEVSRRLNSIVDLAVIDTTLAKITSMVRQAQGKRDIVKERIGEAEQEFEKLKDQQPRIEQFRQLKKLYEEADKAKASHHRVEGFVKDILSYRDIIQPLRERAAEGIDLLETLQTSITFEGKASRLSAIIGEMVHLQSSSSPPPLFDPVERAFRGWRELGEQVQGLAQILSNIDKVRAQADARMQNMVVAEKAFHEKTKGKRCPLCGNIS